MKKCILISLFAILGIINASAQCCPYIGNIQIIPASPTPSDSVTIVVQFTTPNQGTRLGKTHAINGTNIELESCYFLGFLTVPTVFVDSFHIGTLPTGNYTLNVTGYASLDQNTCDYLEDTTNTQLSFVVSANAGIGDYNKNQTFFIYPNPSISQELYIESTEAYDQILFVNQLGQTSKRITNNTESTTQKIMVDDLPSGIYTIVIQNKKGTRLYSQKWIKSSR